MTTIVPDFILKGAKVLNESLQKDLGIEAGKFEITPKLLRDVKFNEVELHDIKMLTDISHQLHLSTSEVNLSPFEIVKELASRSISMQSWRKSREKGLNEELLTKCPRICPPCSPFIQQLQNKVSTENNSNESASLSSGSLNIVIMRYSRILTKITRLKALKTRRAKLIKENIVLLNQVSDLSSSGPRILQNIFDGVCLQDSFSSSSSKNGQSILEEMHSLSEILQQVEADQKEEETFWRWINTQNNVASPTVTNAPSTENNSKVMLLQQVKPVLAAVDEALKTVDGKIVELMIDRKSQLYEHSDALLETLSKQLEAYIAQLLVEDNTSQSVVDGQDTFVNNRISVEEGQESAFLDQTNALWTQVMADVLEVCNAQSPFHGSIAPKFATISSNEGQEELVRKSIINEEEMLNIGADDDPYATF